MSSKLILVVFGLFCLVGCAPQRSLPSRYEPYCHSKETAVLSTEPQDVEGCLGFKFARYERGGIKVKVLISGSENVHKGDKVDVTTVVMTKAEEDFPTLELTHIVVATKAK